METELSIHNTKSIYQLNISQKILKTTIQYKNIPFCNTNVYLYKKKILLRIGAFPKLYIFTMMSVYTLFTKWIVIFSINISQE